MDAHYSFRVAFEAVGQEVPHFHLHVVPRRLAGGWGSGPPQLATVTAGERAAYTDYAPITDAKLSGIAQLQQRLRSGPIC